MKNSYGYDEISTKVLKISAPLISYPVCYICNKSMRSGIFPARLKYATVKQSLKKGSKENVVNFTTDLLFKGLSKTYMTGF